MQVFNYILEVKTSYFWNISGIFISILVFPFQNVSAPWAEQDLPLHPKSQSVCISICIVLVLNIHAWIKASGSWQKFIIYNTRLTFIEWPSTVFGRLAELAVIVWIQEKASVEHYWLFMTWVFYHLLLNSEMVNVCVCVITQLTDNWYCWALICRSFFPPWKVCPAYHRCNLLP